MPLDSGELIARWKTDEGKELLQKVYTALQARAPCTDILAGFPGVEEIASGLDLRGADLSSTSLSGADLSNADLSNANFTLTVLRDADLKNANLSSANLSDANLRGTNLRGANLHGANLRGANLRTANLSNTDRSSANLRSAVPSGANLDDARLDDVDRRDNDLSNANLDGNTSNDAKGLNRPTKMRSQFAPFSKEERRWQLTLMGGLIFAVIIVVLYNFSFFFGTGSSRNTNGEHKEGDIVDVGYTTYAVWRSWWSTKLSDNQFLNQSPNAAYLFVELTVRNDDKKPRMVPPIRLIDENGAEYDASSNGYMVDGAIGILETLNPSVKTRGFIVFDVPKNRKFRMKLSGGYWSAADAYVQLKPKDKR